MEQRGFNGDLPAEYFRSLEKNNRVLTILSDGDRVIVRLEAKQGARMVVKDGITLNAEGAYHVAKLLIRAANEVEKCTARE